MPTAHVWLELGKRVVTLVQYYLQIQKDSRVSHAHLILVHGQLLYSSKIVAYAPISEIDTAITKATEFFKVGILS